MEKSNQNAQEIEYQILEGSLPVVLMKRLLRLVSKVFLLSALPSIRLDLRLGGSWCWAGGMNG